MLIPQPVPEVAEYSVLANQFGTPLQFVAEQTYAMTTDCQPALGLKLTSTFANAPLLVFWKLSVANSHVTPFPNEIGGLVTQVA